MPDFFVPRTKWKLIETLGYKYPKEIPALKRLTKRELYAVLYKLRRGRQYVFIKTGDAKVSIPNN